MWTRPRRIGNARTAFAIALAMFVLGALLCVVRESIFVVAVLTVVVLCCTYTYVNWCAVELVAATG